MVDLTCWEATAGEPVLATPLLTLTMPGPSRNRPSSRAAEEHDRGALGCVRAVWPRRIGGQD